MARDPRPDGRRDRGARADLGRRAAREDEVLHRLHEHVAAVPRGRRQRDLRPDHRGRLLLPARQGSRLGVAPVLPERREVEGAGASEAPDPAAREGHDPSARHPADRGLRLRPEGRVARGRPARLRDHVHAAGDRGRPSDLPRHRLDRHADLRPPAPRLDPVEPQGRDALEHPGRVLPSGARAPGRLPAAPDPRPAGLLDGRPHDGHRAQRHDDAGRDQPGATCPSGWPPPTPRRTR